MGLPSEYIIATARYGVPTRQLQLNVLWYAPSGTIPGATELEKAQAVANALLAQLQNPYQDVTTVETTFVGVSVAYHLSGAVFDAVAEASVTGNVDGDTLPEYCAAVIQKRTTVAGKSGRGRWYIGCVPEAEVDNGRIGDELWDNYQLLAAALVAPVDPGGMNLIPQHHSATNDTLVPFNIAHTNRQLGTQRRRLVRPLI